MSFTVASTDAGVTWQLGAPRIDVASRRETVMANNEFIVGFKSPALPYPPTEYSAASLEEFNRVLRLYFNQVDNRVTRRVSKK